jgi:ppGpp synthetase/RelA/SpoT-type nucleotidyltranferase
MSNSELTHENWYRETRPEFEQLARAVATLLEGLLLRRRIDYLAVTFRTKTVDSFLGKLQRKTYKDPRTEVTDLCGIRVITYLESDLQRVSELIRDIFVIDSVRSVDKSSSLAVDRVGYRSVHFVCKFGRRRLRLPEYEHFAGLVFEIQVRTALQHAWAQIEHDRNYKFGGVLPEPIQRRLFLAAGLLETADREFAAIAGQIDEYASEVEHKTAAGDLDINIDTTSLLSYLREKLSVIEDLDIQTTPITTLRNEVVRELRAFGIHTLRDLDILITDPFLSAIREHYGVGEQNDVGFVRHVMMYEDIRKYFTKAWKHHWGVVDPNTFHFLSDRYGAELVVSTLDEFSIDYDQE